jgi:hypothetical protein
MNVEDRRNFHCWGWVRILLLMANGSMVEAGRGNASQQPMGEKDVGMCEDSVLNPDIRNKKFL